MKTDIETLKKAFSLFVGNDATRPIFLKPFKNGSKYIATDAHSMIFVEADKYDLGFEEQTKLDCARVIPPDSECKESISITILESKLIPTLIPATIECSECEGVGTIECNLGHDHDCDECDGDGEVPDPKGGDMPDPNKEWELLGVTYKDKKLRRLIEACKLLEITEMVKVFGSETKATKLLAGDIGFLIMPCIVEREDVNKITL